MRIKIILGDKSEKEIEVSVKKKHRIKFLDKIEEMKKVLEDDEEKAIGSTKEFMNFQDELAVECSNITQEEWDDMDLDEQEKVTKSIRSAIFPHATGDPKLFF